MTEKLIRLIMKYPFQFLLTSIVLLGIFPVAIFALDYQKIISMGFIAIIGMGAILGSFIILLWWLVSWLASSLLYKRTIGNTTRFYETVKTWKHNILFGSLISGLCSGVIFLCCFSFGWSFKTFYVICIIIPFIRLIIAIIDLKKYKDKDVREMFGMDD